MKSPSPSSSPRRGGKRRGRRTGPLSEGAGLRHVEFTTWAASLQAAPPQAGGDDRRRRPASSTCARWPGWTRGIGGDYGDGTDSTPVAWRGCRRLPGWSPPWPSAAGAAPEAAGPDRASRSWCRPESVAREPHPKPRAQRLSRSLDGTPRPSHVACPAPCRLLPLLPAGVARRPRTRRGRPPSIQIPSTSSSPAGIARGRRRVLTPSIARVAGGRRAPASTSRAWTPRPTMPRDPE